MYDTARVPVNWRMPLASLGFLLLAILVLYAQTASDMVAIWSRSNAYSHGFVVPFITLWLIWRIRHTLAVLQPRPSRSVWLLMLGAVSLWLAGDLVAVNAATQFALVTLLVLSVPALLGWQVAATMAFPLGFLFFSVPIGDFMTPHLMEWTADFTVMALRLSGIPVYREGQQFVIPSGSWSVVEACSGIRYMMASVTVGALFAYLSYRSFIRRLLFICVAILVPLVANWLRAYLVVMIAHISGNEIGIGFDHIVAGWVFFGLVIFAMLFIGARWSEEWMPEPAPAEAISSSDGKFDGSYSSLLATAVALVIVISPYPVLHMLAMASNTVPVNLALPQLQPGWQLAVLSPGNWEPVVQFPSAVAHNGYLGPQGQVVGMHLSYYRQQNYQRKLVSSGNRLIKSDDEYWAQLSGNREGVTMAGKPLSVTTFTLRHQGAGLSSISQRLQVWRWYWVNDRFTSSDAMAKILGALSRLTGRGDDGAIVVLYTPLNSQLLEAEARASATAVLHDFLQAHGGALEAALQQTRGRD